MMTRSLSLLHIVFFFLSLCVTQVISASFSSDAEAQINITWPAPSTSISSPYGPRNLTNPPGASKQHKGVDIRGSTPGVNGDPITAAHNGTVIQASMPSGTGTGYGGVVRIAYPDGTVSTLYGHMNSISVTVGQTVSAGQVIGTMGGAAGTQGAGTSSGTHLHFEVRVVDPRTGATVAIDPLLAMGQDLSNPAVLISLIDTSTAIMGGTVPTTAAATTVIGTSGVAAGFVTQAPSCDSMILDLAGEMAGARMQNDKMIVDETISNPADLSGLSCFDQFGQIFSAEIGGVFSDVTNGLEAFGIGFSNIFGDAMQGMVDSIVDGFSSITNTINSTIDSAISSTIGSLFGLSAGPVGYSCTVMQTLWEIVECQGFDLDFNIPSLGEILDIGGFIDGLMPSSCAGKALFDFAVTAADTIIEDYSGSTNFTPSNIITTLRSF